MHLSKCVWSSHNILLASDRCTCGDFLPPQNHFRILVIRMKIIPALLVASLIVCSCSRQPVRKATFNVDTLANVYAELLVLHERYTLGKDSLSSQQYEQEYQNVLERHRYTKKEFTFEMESIAASPDEFGELCDRALTRFQEMRRRPPRIGISANS